MHELTVDEEFDEALDEPVEVELTEEQAWAKSQAERRDAELSEARYNKLIALGAPEHKARACCVNEGAFIALRIYLRGK